MVGNIHYNLGYLDNVYEADVQWCVFDQTADFQLDVLAILTTQNSQTNNTSLESPNIELLETEIKLDVAVF